MMPASSALPPAWSLLRGVFKTESMGLLGSSAARCPGSQQLRTIAAVASPAVRGNSSAGQQEKQVSLEIPPKLGSSAAKAAQPTGNALGCLLRLCFAVVEGRVALVLTGQRIPLPIRWEVSRWQEVGQTETTDGWTFSIEAGGRVLTRLTSPLFGSCSVETPPRWAVEFVVWAQRETASRQREAADHVEELLRAFPTNLKASRPIMDFQKEGIRMGLQLGGRVLLCDEMGLGKSMQALAIASHYFQEWPALVIVPATMRLVWRDEAQTWLPHLLHCGAGVQVLSKGSQTIDATAKLVVVSYDLLTRNRRFQVRHDGKPYQVVIADEAHYIKNRLADRTAEVLQICGNARRCLLLSGTPALNRAEELFSQLQAVWPASAAQLEYKQFVSAYGSAALSSAAGHSPRQFSQRCEAVLGAGRRAELNAMLMGSVMIRRLKQDVITQLPAKRRIRIPLAATKLDAGSEEQLATTDMETTSRNPSSTCSAAVMKLFQATAVAKLDSVAAYIEHLLICGLKFLVFAHHYVMLDALQKRLDKLRASYVRIDGRTPHAERATLVKRFQESSDVKVALLSITACGQGLTLTSAQTVVFAELYWVPGQLIQAEDRVHRIGQQRGVEIHYCVAENTLDERIFSIVNEKHRDITGILDGSESDMGAAEAASVLELGLSTPRKRAQQSRDGSVYTSQTGFNKRKPSVSVGLPAQGRMPRKQRRIDEPRDQRCGVNHINEASITCTRTKEATVAQNDR
eukprot:TRINITY_DN80811_c0_g1_i1.p1 TRINITY_DN80811_c0_g1~~TRINITY_DN80811_c0_g1_i1.p1  ORF type:complete len:743 (-),score=119.40 TRINITY_DN80811_c0_g1_i1:193-2421(-)